MKKKRNASDSLQAVLIPKGKAKDREDAMQKARRFGRHMMMIDEMENFWRCKRGHTDHETYYTRVLPSGVQLVYGSEEEPKNGRKDDRRGPEEDQA